MTLSLADVAREIPGRTEVRGAGDVLVRGVHHDSRKVEAGDLFVVRKGQKSDGTKFVADARAKGAVALLVARDAAVDAAGLPVVVVDDIATGLAYSAAAVYGHPAFSLEVVGITGTNGKTTTAHLVRAAIDGASGAPKCGVIGTVGHAYKDLAVDAAHTTPEADELARVMAAMRSRGASHVVMEVSSIALSLGRVRAVRFRVAALTNLTQDHLDFHGTMDAYAAAKMELFTTMGPGSAVVHVDDVFGTEVARQVKAPLVKVSAKVGASAMHADVAPIRATLGPRGIDAELRTPAGEVRVATQLVGRHNLENIVVAVGIAYALDLDVARACEAIGAERGAPGRLERCDVDEDDVTVLVDYAHTPDALARVLQSVRDVSGHAKVIVVFGCGGDRDATKRGPMGEAAARLADHVVITNDNPRSEDPVEIARPIEAAVKAAGRSHVVELDRKKAIRDAIWAAKPGDVVVLAGKGHEDYQIVGTEKRHFDDREEARRALEERRR